MANTQITFTYASAEITRGRNDANLRGTAYPWSHRGVLINTAGAGVTTAAVTTVASDTAGIELPWNSYPMEFLTPPLAADYTISGTVYFLIRAKEDSMSANATPRVVVERVDSQGVVQGTVINSSYGTEVGTVETVCNWSATPTSTTFYKGDRIRIRVAATNATATTMGGGYTFTWYYDGTTVNGSGEGWVTFTEDLTFLTSAPTGTTIYPTNTASDVATAAVDREAWTSRGGGVQNDVVNTAAGFTNPIQLTDTAGGTVVDWWTKQLTAFTLGGRVEVNVRSRDSGGYSAGVRCEIAVCNSDGSSPVVWAAANTVAVTNNAAEDARTIVLAGDDVSVTNGQRLRIRFYIDDQNSVYPAQSYQMSSGGSVTLYYAGSSGATGDTYLKFSQTLTEYSGGPTTIEGSFTANAILRKTITPTAKTIDAVIRKSLTGTPFTANAILRKPTTGAPFTLDAILRKTITPTAKTLDAILRKPTTGAPFTLDAWIVKRVTPTPFTLDAWIVKHVTPTPFTADAILRKTMSGTPFTLDAWIPSQGGTVLAAFSLDAIIRRNQLGSFTLEAVIDKLRSGTPFTLDALVRRTQTPAGFTLNAVLRKSMAGTPFTLDAELVSTVLGSFSLNAWKDSEYQPWSPTYSNPAGLSFTLNAWIAGHFTLDAVIALEIFADGFTRTVASGLGISTGIRPTTYYPTTGSSSVDGSAWVLGSGHSETFWGPPGPVETLVLFDFYVPASLADSSPVYAYHPGTFGSYREYARAMATGDGSTWRLGDEWYYGTFSPTPSTWYRAKFYIRNASGGAIRGKVWKASDPEPTAWLFSELIGAHAAAPQLTDISVTSPAAEPGKLDNLRVFSFGGLVHWMGGLSVDAEILGYHEGSFTLNAVIGRWKTIDAIIRKTQTDRFLVEAFIARNTFTLDAQIRPGGIVSLDAVIVGPKTGGFTLDAFVFNGSTHVYGWHLDAVLRQVQYGKFSTRAEIARAHFAGGGSAYVDALIRDTILSSFTLDALIVSRYRASSFHVDADIRGLHEQRGTFTLNASLLFRGGDRFTVDALIEAVEVFKLDAWFAGRILLDAVIVGSVPGSISLNAWIAGRFTLDAWINGPQTGTFTIDATLADTQGAFPGREGSFTLDSWVLAHMDGDPPIWLDAWIVKPGQPGSFTVDAFVQPYFTLDAWTAWPDGGLYGGIFTLDAYIWGNDTIIWPDDGGPAIYPDGEPVPDWFKANRKYRVRVILDGVEVTGDVIWQQTSFTLNAKTGPGTFQLVLRGAFGFLGGEEIVVTIDDLRAFAGYVLSVEANYVFAADPGDPITTLRGADYNVLFDKLIVYNKQSADDPQGAYTNWRSFKKNTLDTTIIHKVFSSYVDLPAGFDYTTHVETVGNAAPEKPWTMPQAGSPVRQVMQSISQTTNGIWWIDVNLKLHYGSRYDVTAPYPITDGLGGISSQNISMSEDMSMLVTETILWGTLAYTVEGDIMAMKKVADSYPTYGPWQYGEFRTDLHHEAFIDRRTDSIIERYGQPIRRAKVVIFDPGYQAGQVADVRLTEHGITAILVIRQVQLVFAVAKEPNGTRYYAVPRYELTIGLDPEEPWDIYDYLPWPDESNPGNVDYPPRRGREEELSAFTGGSPGTNTKYAVYNAGAFAEYKNGGIAVIVGPGSEDWMWAYYDDDNWFQPGSGIYQTPIPYYTYATHQVFGGDAVAGFNHAGYGGRMLSYSTGGQMDDPNGWKVDVGAIPPQAGHEDHTGSPAPNYVNFGDLERRSVMMLERHHGIPLNAYEWRLVSHRVFDENAQQWITDYDIGIMVGNNWVWNEYRGAAAVPYSCSVTHMSLSEGPPDFSGGSALIKGVAGVTYGFQSVGERSIYTPWPDLLWRLGSDGSNPADPMNYFGRYCPLDYEHIYDPIPRPEQRPGPSPVPVYMFCPYHLGPFVYLDAIIHGTIPVQNQLSTNVEGCEVTFPTGPGWGWDTAKKFNWLSGSNARLDEDSSCDFLAASGVFNGTRCQKYAFLALPVPGVELDAYHYTQSSVQPDPDDPMQESQTADWAFEFTGYFEGASGEYGDSNYGPALLIRCGEATLEIFPGYRLTPDADPGVVYTRMNLPEPYYFQSPVNLYEPFHVQFVSSADGWGAKVWQHGSSIPVDWFSWNKNTEPDPERSIGSRPYFRLWQDRWRHGTSKSPWADVNLRFVCMDYEFLDGVNPLTFGLGWASDPNGGYSTEMPSRIDDPDGQIFGMVGDGWNYETIFVCSDELIFETTARVTRGTLSVYNADGIFLHPVDDWRYYDGSGQRFILTRATLKVTVVYRAWVVNVRSEYSVPRQPDPSGIRHRPIPEPS